jgi:hypothetical protein
MKNFFTKKQNDLIAWLFKKLKPNIRTLYVSIAVTDMEAMQMNDIERLTKYIERKMALAVVDEIMNKKFGEMISYKDPEIASTIHRFHINILDL